MYRRGQLRTSGELLDALAAEVRANPSDRERVEHYLVGNNDAGKTQNVAWLAEISEMHNAYEYFEFGQRLQPFSPEARCGSLRKTVADFKGHQFGDRLLVKCAERLREDLPQTDTLWRYGGDESINRQSEEKESQPCASAATSSWMEG